MLNAVWIPDGSRRRRRCAADCLKRFGIEIGGGLGDFKGRAWRIGLMGHSLACQ